MAAITRARRRGRAWGAGLALAALLGGVGLAASSTPSDPTDRPHLDPAPSALSVGWVGGLSGDAPCPEGMTRRDTLRQDTFSGGIPLSRFNEGWGTVGGGVTGNAARSHKEAGVGAIRDYFFLPYAEGTPGRTTMLAYAHKGSTPNSWSTRAAVNGSTFTQSTSSSWRGQVRDVTAATDDEDGALGTRFEHLRPANGTSTWDVSNVQLYTCRDANLLRLAGDDRYRTAAAISSEYAAGQDTVYIASGDLFPDALTGAAAAAREDSPLLLVQKWNIPQSTAAELERLAPERIVLVGGNESVSSAVRSELTQYSATGQATRIAGGDRYETASAVARARYEPGVDTVYVATGQDYPDALTGGSLAGREHAPVLFVQPGRIPSTIASTLDYLEPENVVVLGGRTAVSESVRTQLREYAGSGEAPRLGGSDRYETAEAIARHFGKDGVRVYVATGSDFPDALAASARAGSQGLPLVLARPDGLPSSTRSALWRLEANRGVVVGGGNVLYSIVMDQLGRYTP